VANGQGTNDNFVVADLRFVIAAVLASGNDLCREASTSGRSQPPNVSGKRIRNPRQARTEDSRGGARLSTPCRLPQPQSQSRCCASRYFDSLVGLAQWSDVLVCLFARAAKPPRHRQRRVGSALGPGLLVNIGRGSVVDTEALALRDGRIAGAGLDVYESEPGHAPKQLIGWTT
jgi:hypothetical protein